MTHVAIIGAGVSGLATAYGLRTLPIDVTVFEKSRGYGGRVATRGRHGNRYDHGANYFTASTDRIERLVTAHLPTKGLVEIGRAIWGFDQDGSLKRPSSDTDELPKWTYRQGISQLGKLLARYSRADVRTETTVTRLTYQDAGWEIHTDDGPVAPAFDAVVLTPPAPQTASILANSTVSGERILRIQRAIESISYTSQFSFVFAFDRSLSRPGDFYGLVNEGHSHPIAWLGFEHDKPGHVQSGESMIIIQTAPDWTAERIEEDPEEFVFEIKEKAEDVLISDLRHPAWYDVQRWRYASPTSGLGDDVLAAGEKLGLFFAGDYVSGVGRVEEALEMGFDAAHRLRKWQST